MARWALRMRFSAAAGYDGLAETLGSKVAAPGIGFSIGEDRLVMAAEEGSRAARTTPRPVCSAHGARSAETLRSAGNRSA